MLSYLKELWNGPKPKPPPTPPGSKVRRQVAEGLRNIANGIEAGQVDFLQVEWAGEDNIRVSVGVGFVFSPPEPPDGE